MRRSLVSAALLACAAAGSAMAQAGPEATAREFAHALKAGDWAGAARIMHPSALRQLVQVFEPVLAHPDGRDAAELFGVASPEELKATPDTVLFAAFLRSVMSQQEMLSDALKTARYTALGHVSGGGDTVFVVSRMILTVEGVNVTNYDVMPFVRENGRWWGLLKAEFTNMAAMLQRALSARKT